MATENLTVKFKVDASGVKQGADEAKQKVKQAAAEMESDVKHSSDSMESHLDKVAQSAKKVGGAASSAGSGVKDLEQQVVQSSNRMEDSLDKVAEKVKGISARQAVGIASRALGVAGNVAGWMGENYAEDEGSKAGWDTASSALSGAAQGAMLGGAIGTIFGPIGTAIGGAAGALAGAAAGLFAASKELEKAAKDLEKSSESKMLNAGKDLYERRRKAEYDEEASVFQAGLDNGTLTPSEIFAEQRKRQEWLAKKTAERDQFVSEHQYDTGEAAVNAAAKLDLLERAIDVANDRINAFASVVDAAKEIEEEGVKEAKKAIEERKKEAKALRDRIEADARDAEKSDRKLIARQSEETRWRDISSANTKEAQGILESSGLKGLLDAQAKNKADLDNAIKELDDYTRRHKDVGNARPEDVAKIASTIFDLQQAVSQATQRFKDFSPLVQEQGKKLEEQKRNAESTLTATQRQLEGVMSKPANSPTDSLTRIGGGRGYTDYNNSTAKVQMSIEANLKTLVSNQQRQLQEIINKMENFSATGTWAE